MQPHPAIESIVALPEVEGAFLSHEDGRVIAQEMPSGLAAEQVEKATRLLNQNRDAASVTVGDLQYSEFRYLEHKIFIYYFKNGHLLLLCRSTVNPERIALEVNLQRREFDRLLSHSPVNTQPPKQADAGGPPPDSQQKKKPQIALPHIIALALLVIAIVAGSVFYFAGAKAAPEKFRHGPAGGHAAGAATDTAIHPGGCAETSQNHPASARFKHHRCTARSRTGQGLYGTGT